MPHPAPTSPLPVGLLGATGSVGQVFTRLLSGHPWFRLERVHASERSAGKPYGEAANWVQPVPLDGSLAGLRVEECVPPADGPRLYFSALDASVAGPVELAFAAAGHVVVSNAKNHRMAADVPLCVPEVNPEHLELVRHQDYGPGAILTNPNCSTIGLVLALAPLVPFGVRRVHVVSLQALSGAGIPGVPSMVIADNVVPYIGGEEDKLETETAKILGRYADGAIEHADVRVSATCTRVPVTDGHTLCVSVELGQDVSEDEIVDAWTRFEGEPQRLGLPSAPERPVVHTAEPDQPQPRLMRDLGGGMSATVGRLRPCPLFGWKFVTLSHNTVRGAAGGSLLVGELALARGLVDRD